ncbi:MAG: valine--tRNA ligase, partial [Acidimicrobiaceae bacterium]|nr:valine--tRNA ligase [Acidimicrobiaceae bacterium]
WYIRNGGRDDDLRQALIDRGNQMNWVPGYMRARYESWIAGLSGDWLISRQRFFGVPIPLWYRLDADGSPDWHNPIRPDPGTLPVDPSSDCPPGYDESQRGRPGGFAGDPDVMDTWATSSLTPQIATGWRTDEALYASTFPMDMRPQAHDIIRTWLFSTVVRAHFDAGTVPWYNCALSGWILDPDRKKMSKSRGNVQVPTDLLERYGADAVRYWAACGRPGTDTAFDEQQFRIGRRLAVKLLNASKFVLRFDDPGDGDVTEALDRSMLHRLADLVDEATRALDAFDYARALERTESFFWSFTDDHLELVKARAYGEQGPDASVSARRALRTALGVLQQLFAPFMPFVAEEVWRWWHPSSVHASAWPQSGPLRAAAGDAGALPGAVAAAVLGEVRRAKSEAKRPLRTEVDRATVTDTAERIAVLEAVADDVCAAGRVSELVTAEGRELAVACELAPEAAA